MGIYYGGGMLVGCHGSKFSLSESCPKEYLGDLHPDKSVGDLYNSELLDILGMSRYAEYYCAEIDSSHVGFPVEGVPIDSVEFEGWLINVKVLAAKFEAITGVKARLIGCQKIR
jgi:hypothetical protein